MGVNVELSSDYGYVISVILATIVLLNWMTYKVFKARLTYKVEYPVLYSAETSGDGHMFNCIQRVHQNTLEVLPLFFVLLLLGGLEFPKVSAAAGMLWVFSRVVYAYGYYTGDPKNRNRGAFGIAALLTLLINTIILTLDLLDFV